MKKSLIVFSVVILLISLSFVSASWFSNLFSGDVTRTTTSGQSTPASIGGGSGGGGGCTSNEDCAPHYTCVTNPNTGKKECKYTPGTSIGTSGTSGTRTSLASQPRYAGWTAVERLGGGTCYTQNLRSKSLFNKRG